MLRFLKALLMVVAFIAQFTSGPASALIFLWGAILVGLIDRDT